MRNEDWKFMEKTKKEWKGWWSKIKNFFSQKQKQKETDFTGDRLPKKLEELPSSIEELSRLIKEFSHELRDLERENAKLFWQLSEETKTRKVLLIVTFLSIIVSLFVIFRLIRG